MIGNQATLPGVRILGEAPPRPYTPVLFRQQDAVAIPNWNCVLQARTWYHRKILVNSLQLRQSVERWWT
jgi:hypothetical protein